MLDIIWNAVEDEYLTVIMYLLCSIPMRFSGKTDKQIVLLLDGAGWHKSATLSLPRGIQLLFLPPYSPEVQQAPRLWPLSNEPLANRMFASLDELEQVQAERCRWLQDHPAVVRAHTCFHWWPSLDST